MTSKGNGREPSMDEIMSQIRSIIAADESKGRPPMPRAPDARADTDVLELTEMVNEDGSVSQIGAGAPAGAVPSGAATKAAAPAKPPIADTDDGFGVTPTPPADLAPIFAGASTADAAPQPRPASPPPPMVQPVTVQPIVPQPVMAKPVAPPAVAMPMGTSQPSIYQPPQPPAPVPPLPARPQSGAPAAPMSELISNAAAGAAASALERLATASQQQQAKPVVSPPALPILSVGNRSLEDLVQELLRPMLKQWLDSNLPSIVERMVAQEIIKISKR